MANYLISFLIYTTAMIGVIFVALFTFKTFSNKCFSKKSTMLNIEDSMNLSPRKTLYVIKAKNERFLVAADVDRTTLIAKLDENNLKEEIHEPREDKSSSLKSFDGVESMSEFSSLVDFKKNKNKEPMMRELAKKLSVI